jgi:radical SAM superfamily enzyme YgiQ (UPF0313 family)
MNKRCTTEENHYCLKIAKEIGVGAYCNMIITTPESTLEDVEATVNAAYEYTQDPFYHVGVTLGIKPLKGTDYFETFSDFKTRIVKIENSNYFLKYDDLIYADDIRVKTLQIRYWNEIDDFITTEREEQDIRHGTAKNLSALKLIFLKKIINDIKNNKLSLMSNNTESLNKKDPYNERQTVDIDLDIEYKAKNKKSKKNKKSRYGSWS